MISKMNNDFPPDYPPPPLPSGELSLDFPHYETESSNDVFLVASRLDSNVVNVKNVKNFVLRMIYHLNY